MDHIQPEPYTYTDPMGDALIIGFIRMVSEKGPVDSVAFTVINDPDSATAYVPLSHVEQVLTAIRTAAGHDQPIGWAKSTATVTPCAHCDAEVNGTVPNPQKES